MTSNPNNHDNSALSSQSSKITEKFNSDSETTVSEVKTINNQSSPVLGIGKIIIIGVASLATLATILFFMDSSQICFFSDCGISDNSTSGSQNLIAVIFAIGGYIVAITLGLTMIPAFLVSLVVWFITQML